MRRHLAQRLSPLVSLRMVLTLPYVVLVLALAFVIGSISYRAGSDAVDHVAGHLLRETVGRVSLAVQRHVDISRSVLQAAFPPGRAAPADIAAALPALRERFWVATSISLDPTNYAYYGNRSGQFFGLWRHSETEGELRLRLQGEGPRTISRFTGIDGELRDGAREERIFEPRERPWYRAAIAAPPGDIWSRIYIDFRTQGLVATRVRRVFGADGSFEGVVATDVSLRGLNEFVRQLQPSRQGFVFIVEADGGLIAASSVSNVADGPDGQAQRLSAADSGDARLAAVYAAMTPKLAQAQPDGRPVALRVTAPDGELIDVAFARVADNAGLDWVIAAAVPRSDFMAGVTGNVKRTVAAASIAVLLVLALGWVILNWVARDLKRLSVAAGRIGEGDEQPAVEIRRRDEIGDLARSFSEMQRMLQTDRLTGLLNRASLMRRLATRIEHQRRVGDDEIFGVLFIDLNHFKDINDRLGHEVGDRVLIEVANRLREGVRQSDTVARYAGDEFVVLLDPVRSVAGAHRAREKIEALMRQPYAGLPPTDGAAIGLAVYPDDGTTAEALIQHADADMYSRKREAGIER